MNVGQSMSRIFLNANTYSVIQSAKHTTEGGLPQVKNRMQKLMAFICAICMLLSGNGDLLAYAMSYNDLVTTLTASDGNSYRVQVSYDEYSGIPEDAVLRVTEITSGDGSFNDYVSKSAEALDKSSDSFEIVKAFDISILDRETGIEYQPGNKVSVSIELLSDDEVDYSGLDVIHIHNKDEEKADLLKSKAGKDSIEFKTDGFSVYVLAEVNTYTYRFFIPRPGVDVAEITQDDCYLISGWNDKYMQTFAYTDSGAAYSQTIKGGEKPVVPEQSTIQDRPFAGWYEGTPIDGQNIKLSRTAYDFDSIPQVITGTRTIDLYARYSDFFTLVFHDQYNEDLEGYPVTAVKRAEIVSDSSLVSIDDINSVYSGGSDFGFYGWSKTPLRYPGTGKNSKIDETNIELTEDTHLYPVFLPIHWLSYYSAQSGSGASYVPTTRYFDNDSATAPAQLQPAVWEGHTFEGWYTGHLNIIDNGDGTYTEEVVYETKVTDANGIILDVNIDNVLYRGQSDYKLYLLADTTLYAKWDDTQTMTSYKLIIWKQKASATSAAAVKYKYDFAESYIKTVPVGSMAVIDDAYKHYDTSDPTNYGGHTSHSDADVTVNPKGYTVLNVYYDRDNDAYTPSGTPHMLTFVDSADPSHIYAQSENPLAYGTSILTGNEGNSFVPAKPTRENFSFTGWFADRNCTTQVFFSQAELDAYTGYNNTVLYDKMPDYDLMIYAGWEADWYIVQVDPNYGSLNGSGGTWFWETVDGDLVQEYTQVTRDYVPSNSGSYYFVKKDRAYYGYSGNEWDNSESDRKTYYTTNPALATEDTIFSYSPGVYSYAGWYEVHSDGSETPYDFSQHVTHDTNIKLHWKKSGFYYAVYNAEVMAGGYAGVLSGEQDYNAYSDNAKVIIGCSAIAPEGYTFAGWHVRGDESGLVYGPGQTFSLNAEYAERVNGRDNVYLDAVYVKSDSAKIVYNANGGSITGADDAVDFGSYSEIQTSSPVTNISDDRKTASVTNIINNSGYILSTGAGFSMDGAEFMGWSTKPVVDGGAAFFDASAPVPVIVDNKEPFDLYAVWGVEVTYHKNNNNATWGGTGDGAWPEPYYSDTVNAEQVYKEKAYIGNAVTEPPYIPVSSEATELFYNWKTSGGAIYDFSTPVTGSLDLYANWSGLKTVPVHILDATQETIVEKSNGDGWSIDHAVQAGKAASGFSTPSAFVTSPEDYVFAFAAAYDASANIQSVSETDKIIEIKYDSAKKAVTVRYDGAENFTTLPAGYEIYFVYYKKEHVSITYQSMGLGGTVELDTHVAAAAPKQTDELGTGVYDIKDAVSTPLAWISGYNSYSYYAYALDADDSSGGLTIITDVSNADGSGNSLKLRNTWRGFEYSENGTDWSGCGYDPKFYVIYYEQQPSIITVTEKTVGTEELIDSESFNYEVSIVNSNPGDPAAPVISFSLKSGESRTLAAYYWNDGGEHKQTVTVTQTTKAGFTTENASSLGAITAANVWTYTTNSSNENPDVLFTNTNDSQPVELHVAIVKDDGIYLQDDQRNAAYKDINVPFNSSVALTSAVTPSALFSGDASTYAFGAVIYGTDGASDGSIIDVRSLDLASVSYARTDVNRDDIYELLLKNNSGAVLDEMGSYNIYYLYYPMPQIRYVKQSNDGSLTDIVGATTGSITYEGEVFEMNGQTVCQNQHFEIPRSGFKITQNSGVNTFRMPSILDEGSNKLYLLYTKLGAGAGNATNISQLGSNVSSEREMYLKISDNQLQFSFDNSNWTNLSLTGEPTIYAIYQERGYDLRITKSVPVSGGGTPNFTVTVSSSAIKQPSYSIAGAGVDGTTVAAVNGVITLAVRDGSDYTISGLPQGTYFITESGNTNYILTAQIRSLSGGTADNLDVSDNSTVEFELDREKRVDLKNTAKTICKVNDGASDHNFYSLSSAVEYIKNSLSGTGTIQMMTDYEMPASDDPVILSSHNITLTTATMGYYGHHAGATIYRAPDNNADFMINNKGVLSVNNIWFDGKNVSSNKAMISSSGTLTLDTVTMENANGTGLGGALYIPDGTVTVSNSVFDGNTTSSGGGAVYSSVSLTISNTAFTNNSASSGGAIYAASGAVNLNDGVVMTGNHAVSNGGAVFIGNGALNMTGGTIGGSGAGSANSAQNGSAVYVLTGNASFSGGRVTGNVASEGGAVAVGNAMARLYFSGNAYISGNTSNTDPSNVYLNFDSDAIINATGLNAVIEGVPYIGINVPGALDDPAAPVNKRGVPGNSFGSFTNSNGLEAFHNDRLNGLSATGDLASKHIVWGKGIQVQVRYLERYSTASGLPNKKNGAWIGDDRYPGSGNWITYNLPSNNNPVSAIADDLRAHYSLGISSTSIFGHAFLDDGSDNIGFEKYLTDVNWSGSDWTFIDRNGESWAGSKLVVYFTEPSYITIENNSNYPVNITDLVFGSDMLNYHAVNTTKSGITDGQPGYGYVYAINGAVQSTLRPIVENDFKLGVGKSIKLLFPGSSVTSQPYTVTGTANLGSGPANIPVRQDGVASVPQISGSGITGFSLANGKTSAVKGGTVSIIFGGDRPICKIVTNIDVTPESGECTGTDPEESGTAYLFATLKSAVAFAQKYAIPDPVVEMVADYMIPASDTVDNIASGTKITFDTAIGSTDGNYYYSSDPADRATISRGTNNNTSFIKVTDGGYAVLTVRNLILDGKNFAGTINGGLVATYNSNVVIDHVDFVNCKANNGGGIYIDFKRDDDTDADRKLYITNTRFDNCESISKENRQGGGAIYTTAKELVLLDSEFSSCNGIDQGGAVFHRIDTAATKYTAHNYALGSKAIVSGCTFSNCQARSGGALESDAHTVIIGVLDAELGYAHTDKATGKCTFTDCTAYHATRGGNGGGVNTYIYEGNGVSLGRKAGDIDISTSLTVRGCTFTNCVTNGPSGGSAGTGGGLRSQSLYNVIEDCEFTGCYSNNNGGALCINNDEAISASLINCSVSNSNSINGGGVYINIKNYSTTFDLIISGCAITNNTASNQGGGLHTNTPVTFINTSITNNHLTGDNIMNAAGAYVTKNITIGVTAGGVETTDTTEISNNTINSGSLSNLRIREGLKPNEYCVTVNCSLVGSIGIINPGNVGSQFGYASTSSPSARPKGLADPTDENPNYWPSLTADDRSTYGIIDRADDTRKRVIWAGPPICKITDINGNLLYLDKENEYPAIFDHLSGGSEGGWNSPFALLQGNKGKLYDSNNFEYPKNQKDYPYVIKMMVQNYDLTSTIDTGKGSTTKTIILTTAGSNDASYPYRGDEGTYCTIKRSGFTDKTMIRASCNLNLTNITLDGGSNEGLKAAQDGGIILIIDQGNVIVELGSGAVLQNSYTSGNGGAVSVEWSDFNLNGGKIVNCKADLNGGGVYMNSVAKPANNPNRGFLRFFSGDITDCSAANGGGLYVNAGSFTMDAVTIRGCSASGNGGGICFVMGKDDKDNTKKDFLLAGGTISGCSAGGSGGGIFIADNKYMQMRSAFVMGNHAGTAGGGIAFGGANAYAVFSQTPYVSGNTLGNDNRECNVEMNQSFDDGYNPAAVIRNNGLTVGARIGVYVPDPQYENHGDNEDRFATFANASQTGTLYSFVNDRNGLKGGLLSDQDPSTDKKIYWIKIYSLEVSKTVDSDVAADNDQEFAFRIKLSGTADDTSAASSINNGSDYTKYGRLIFKAGECTEMYDPVSETVVPLKLKSGESVTAERLPKGLSYTVEEIPTASQKKIFATVTYRALKDGDRLWGADGLIGEYSDNTDGENKYLMKVKFVNLRPTCKIVNQELNSVLYTRATYPKASKNGAGIAYTDTPMYLPALFKSLNEAFDKINTAKMYYKYSGTTYSEYNSMYAYKVSMLTNVALTDTLTLNNGKKAILTTAGKYESEFPFRESETPAVITRAFADGSMIVSKGDMTINNIVLDGARINTVTADGGIVNVPSGGKLRLSTGSVLRNSITSGNGGAVYVAAGGNIYLSGNPSFGGAGLHGDGSIDVNTGNFTTAVTLDAEAKNGGKSYNSTTMVRQDIYLAETSLYPASMIVTATVTSPAGSIWVWAVPENHYKKYKPFAQLENGSESSCRAFRNSRPDSETDSEGVILYGQKGASDKYIHWLYPEQGGGGEEPPVISGAAFFTKIDGFGNGLGGAVFTMFIDSTCQNELLISGSHATAVSAADGSVEFTEIPEGTYYMKESALTGYRQNEAVYTVVVDHEGNTTVTNSGGTELTYVMNISTIERRVILDMINNTKTALPNAQFDILYVDGSVFTSGVISGDAGAFYVGTMPIGKYTVHEKTVPTGYKNSDAGGWWWTLVLNADGTITCDETPKTSKPEYF